MMWKIRPVNDKAIAYLRKNRKIQSGFYEN